MLTGEREYQEDTYPNGGVGLSGVLMDITLLNSYIDDLDVAYRNESDRQSPHRRLRGGQRPVCTRPIGGLLMLVKHGTGADAPVSGGGARHQSAGPVAQHMARREAEASEEVSKAMRPTRIYLAGPLFTASEQRWNEAVCSGLEDLGFEVFLPQRDAARLLAENGEEFNAANLFDADVYGLYWADIIVCNYDGADPDSGTSWEAGKVYGIKPLLWYRTDMRKMREVPDTEFNLMLTQSGIEVTLGTEPWTWTAIEVAQQIHSTIQDL